MRKRSELYIELRNQAEKVLKERAADGGGRPSDADLLHLFHELEIHQVELDLQNEELRRAQKELEDSRDQYLDLYDSAPVGFVTIDTKGLVSRVNRAAEEMLAGSDRALIGEVFSRRIYPEDYKLFRSVLKEVAEFSGRQACEVRLAGKDGILFYVRLETGARFDESGRLSEWRLALSDITERKKNEQAIAVSQLTVQRQLAELEAIYNAVHVGLCVLDTRFRFQRINERLAEMNGIPKSDHIEKSVREIMPDFADQLEAILQKVMYTRKPVVNIEFPHPPPRPNVVRTLRGDWFPIKDKEDNVIGIHGMIADVTEQKQAKKELEIQVQERTAQLSRRALQLSRLTSELTLAEQRERRRLAEILHDDLQQVLVSAKIGLEVLANRMIHEQKGEAERIVGLIQDSIQISRSLTAELSPPVLYIGGFSAALEWLSRWMQDHHGFRVELKVDPRMDPQREDLKVILFQSVREMLFNAVKHSGVKTARVEMGSDGKKRLRVAVIDQGVGFDPDILWKKAQEGTGFGLFSIRERLALMDGSLEVESSPGGGACFHLVLPLETTTEKDGKSIEKNTTETNGDKIRVLLADDHAVVRRGLSTMLALFSDIEVVGEAADGKTAVSMSQELKPNVILMDIDMPNMDGLEATRIIHSQFPHIRIIGLSMLDTDIKSSAMLDAGASAYYPKGGDPDVLLSVIRDEGKGAFR